MTKNPAVLAAKDNHDPFAVRTAMDGAQYQLRPVSPAIMDVVTAKIETPKVPMWFNKEMDREEPNPNHPDYILSLEAANRQRGTAIFDALVMFGVELVNGLPKSDEWLRKLKYMIKHGMIALDDYDLEDPYDQEFLYKRYILATGAMVNEIGNLSALTAEDVKAAGASFPGNS
jgi:hypothetical protein